VSKYQRTKGAAFERKVAALFREAMPGAECRRNLQPQGGRVAGNDLVVPMFGVECKVGKLPNPRAALLQAERDASPELYPIAVVQDDRQPPFVVVRLEAFLEMVGEWWRETQ